tara:strand:+ start:268 stop:696 length:429 start_codon:yes stop_codon:yes gene_type:complete
MIIRILALLLLSNTAYALDLSSNTARAIQDLDLTIPEQPPVYVEPVNLLNLDKTYNKPSRCQLTLFWTLNALDVWTSHRALKSCPNCREVNPLLPDRPSLEELILLKVIVAGSIHHFGSAEYITLMNGTLAFVVHNNYQLIK